MAFRINVKTVKNVDHSLEVNPGDSIESIADRAENELALGPINHVLFQGKILKRETTVAENRIEANAVLVVVGGKKKKAAAGGAPAAAAPAKAKEEKPAVAPAPVAAPVAAPVVDAAAEQARLQAMAGLWSCGMCTYMNKAVQPMCEMCGTPNPQAPAMGGGGGGGGPAGPWSCPTCTFNNPPAAGMCNMCNTPNPAAPARGGGGGDFRGFGGGGGGGGGVDLDVRDPATLAAINQVLAGVGGVNRIQEMIQGHGGEVDVGAMMNAVQGEMAALPAEQRAMLEAIAAQAADMNQGQIAEVLAQLGMVDMVDEGDYYDEGDEFGDDQYNFDQ